MGPCIHVTITLSAALDNPGKNISIQREFEVRRGWKGGREGGGHCTVPSYYVLYVGCINFECVMKQASSLSRGREERERERNAGG